MTARRPDSRLETLAPLGAIAPNLSNLSGPGFSFPGGVNLQHLSRQIERFRP
jgi:hypothetical protein